MNRREFLRGSAYSTLVAGLGASAIELRADPPAAGDKPAGPPITCAVIGLNLQGREILHSLAKLGSSAPVAAICDTFSAPTFVKKSAEIVPNAKFYTDYKEVLDDKTIQAVFIATPSHKHKQIALDALAAGKHVYCEAPLATDLAEAKAIAVAGQAAKTLFQPGLQTRCNLQYNHVLGFIRAHATGNICLAKSQFHTRDSWRRQWPTDERANELNWRLSKGTSTGLPGEEGIHHFDVANWFIKDLPIAVTGYGAIMGWKDGRDVPDTAVCVFEYPNNLSFVYDATLVASFDAFYDLIMGTDCSIQLRDQRAWMFKEGDSTLLGWEVYARKDQMSIGDVAAGSGISLGEGIALVADATKQLALGKQPGQVGTDVTKTSVYQAADAFLNSIRTNSKPQVGALEGYQATVISHIAHDAVLAGARIAIEPNSLKLEG